MKTNNIVAYIHMYS